MTRRGLARRLSRAQHGKNDFADWLQSLPDQIALHEAQGLPIIVADPGTEHGRRLVRALGARIEGEQPCR